MWYMRVWNCRSMSASSFLHSSSNLSRSFCMSEMTSVVFTSTTPTCFLWGGIANISSFLTNSTFPVGADSTFLTTTPGASPPLLRFISFLTMMGVEPSVTSGGCMGCRRWAGGGRSAWGPLLLERHVPMLLGGCFVVGVMLLCRVLSSKAVKESSRNRLSSFITCFCSSLMSWMLERTFHRSWRISRS